MKPISVMSVAATACEESGWRLTNLELQKILYLSHMKALGQYGEPLIKDDFEAWKYGPVVSRLYHKLKPFGDARIKDVFMVDRNLRLTNHKIVKDVVNYFGNFEPFELVELTHKPGGAWDKRYNPDLSGIVIPNRLIRGEYLEDPF